MEPTYHKKVSEPHPVTKGLLNTTWPMDSHSHWCETPINSPTSSCFLPPTLSLPQYYIVSCGDEGWEAMWWSRAVQNPRYCSLDLKIDGQRTRTPKPSYYYNRLFIQYHKSYNKTHHQSISMETQYHP